VPHLAGTALRFWLLRAHVDRNVLLRFGLMSAAGGLVGAYLHSLLHSPALTLTLAALLVFAAVSGLTGLEHRLRFSPPWHGPRAPPPGCSTVWSATREASALPPCSAWACPKMPSSPPRLLSPLWWTARLPVYAFTVGEAVAREWRVVLAGTVAVLIRTLVGRSLLERLSERRFRRAISVLLWFWPHS